MPTERAALAARASAPAVLITCEHGGNLVPAPFEHLFVGKQRVVHSHRGWDPGALELAGALSIRLQAPMCFALTTRLLIDLNRSLGQPSLFSEFTRDLPARDRSAALSRHYHPYRRHVTGALRKLLRPSTACVLHVSVHTFTPVLNGTRRTVDIGILFDPSRSFESRIAHLWQSRLAGALPRLKIAPNQPYRGTDDGLTTYLRTLHPDRRYAGLEIEVNQRFPRRGGPGWNRLIGVIATTLADTLTILGDHRK